ncbi:Uncharacterised protein [Mycobacterium tuberculosis]|uniref:Uncharacterized protein n=1 Tax=Mycobacterium tuberculosis TaxID=1773 RepID=A0A916LE12_MYCTX|nr:Uncharacterised protein [Mycobacterium tuberculosis]COZ46818.1 Uncharacterised protein [Mycobacterium tuberculosis]
MYCAASACHALAAASSGPGPMPVDSHADGTSGGTANHIGKVTFGCLLRPQE